MKEWNIKTPNGSMTLREPFFPCPSRKLSKLKRILLEDIKGKELAQDMAIYCMEQYNSYRLEVKASYRDGAGKREIQHLNGLANKAVRYKNNAEVITAWLQEI